MFCAGFFCTRKNFLTFFGFSLANHTLLYRYGAERGMEELMSRVEQEQKLQKRKNNRERHELYKLDLVERNIKCREEISV